MSCPVLSWWPSSGDGQAEEQLNSFCTDTFSIFPSDVFCLPQWHHKEIYHWRTKRSEKSQQTHILNPEIPSTFSAAGPKARIPPCFIYHHASYGDRKMPRERQWLSSRYQSSYKQWYHWPKSINRHTTKINHKYFYLDLTWIIKKTKTVRREFMPFNTFIVTTGQRRHATHSCFCSLHTSMPGFLETSFGAKGMSGVSCMSVSYSAGTKGTYSSCMHLGNLQGVLWRAFVVRG